MMIYDHNTNLIHLIAPYHIHAILVGIEILTYIP